MNRILAFTVLLLTGCASRGIEPICAHTPVILDRPAERVFIPLKKELTEVLPRPAESKRSDTVGKSWTELTQLRLIVTQYEQRLAEIAATAGTTSDP